MIEDVELAREFERHRARLRAIAHRILGSQAEADDAVQETWLRLSRTNTAAIENLGAWLTTVVSRVCLNVLRARDARHEVLVDQIPDPVPDSVWEVAARHYDEQELAALVLSIATVNVWNRLNVATRRPRRCGRPSRRACGRSSGAARRRRRSR